MPTIISTLVGRWGHIGAAAFTARQAERSHCSRTHAWAANNLLRAIHKLDSANKVVSCAVFFFSPR